MSIPFAIAYVALGVVLATGLFGLASAATTKSNKPIYASLVLSSPFIVTFVLIHIFA